MTPPAATTPATESSTIRRGLVEEQLLEHAAALFADKGFGATSLEDIASRVGMKRPSLYHYFKSKDDILAQIVGNIAGRGSSLVLAAADEVDWDPATKLRAMAHALCVEVGTGPSAFRLVLTNQANMAPELASRLEEGKRTVTRAMTAVIAEGTKQGDFRPVDPRLAALGILGMCNWTAWWFVEGPDNPIEPVAEELAEQAVRSVLRLEGQTRHDGDPRVVLETLRANLDALDDLLPDA